MAEASDANVSPQSLAPTDCWRPVSRKRLRLRSAISRARQRSFPLPFIRLPDQQDWPAGHCSLDPGQDLHILPETRRRVGQVPADRRIRVAGIVGQRCPVGTDWKGFGKVPLANAKSSTSLNFGCRLFISCGGQSIRCTPLAVKRLMMRSLPKSVNNSQLTVLPATVQSNEEGATIPIGND